MNLSANPAGVAIDLNIETVAINKAAWMLRAVDHPLRQKILQIIHSSGRISVSDLQSSLKLSQPVVSQHLGILRKSGFVLASRVGRSIYYSVNYLQLKHIHRVIGDMQNR
jgi:DNA-binding transcriptional ArsR family regulator